VRKLSVLGVSIISLGLISCTAKYANTPTATNFETTQQQVLQAAHHWNVIGERVTKNVTNALKSKVAKNERVLIKQENSAFGKQLHLNLAQALTSNGYRVVKNHSTYDMQKKEYDVLIEPKVQLVKFTRGSQARQRITFSNYYWPLGARVTSIYALWCNTSWCRHCWGIFL
jgi:hypothetical protein